MTNSYDFPVELKDMMLAEEPDKLHVVVPRKKAVVRTDTDEVLAVVSDDYKIVKHEQVLGLFDKVNLMERSNVTLSEDGGIMFARYDYKNNVETSINGDRVNFYIRVFNSYNLYTSVGFEMRGERLVCKNGLVMPSTQRTAVKHIGENRLDYFNKLTGGVLNQKTDIVDTWRRWMKQQVDPIRISKFYDQTNVHPEISERLETISNEKTNMWEAFNVLTYYTTHDMKSKGVNKIGSRRKRENDLVGGFYKFFAN